jgi:hypothetical protein
MSDPTGCKNGIAFCGAGPSLCRVWLPPSKTLLTPFRRSQIPDVISGIGRTARNNRRANVGAENNTAMQSSASSFGGFNGEDAQLCLDRFVRCRDDVGDTGKSLDLVFGDQY